jgi:ribosomal-protein-serine acetyltransferase
VRTLFIDERTVLRPLFDNDTGPLFAVVEKNRSHLRRFLPWLDSTRSKDDVKAFRTRVGQQEADGTGLLRVIERDNRLCGVVAFNHINTLNNRAEIGYWLDQDCQGQGLCRRSCELLVGYGFGELQLNRIAIAAAVDNRRSRSVAEGLGFKLEGVLREAEWLYDHYVDHALYAQLRREWEAARSR